MEYNRDNVAEDAALNKSPVQPERSQIPNVGMTFSSEEELREFYKSYAQSTGFGICKVGTKNGQDGKQKYFTIACAKSGMKASRSKNVLQPRPTTKTNCKAKINVVIRNEEEFVITSVCLEHNHTLSPGKTRHIRSYKVIDANAKRRLELNDEAGITLSKSFHSFVVEAGGYDNLSFDERSCRNFITEARRLRLGSGDAEALSNYFLRMQSRNSNFFYLIDLDEESRIRNVFWADGRCRAVYEYFSDVITFDTTYLTNRYDMPFAPFVGVNHHGQSILLGCGLLSSEDSESFTWLFTAWLTCMLGRAPNAIITDQCRSMAIAIEKVFPKAHHRVCLWHIMKKLPTKLGSHAEYKLIKKRLKNIVYNSITIQQCEDDWKGLIEDFQLGDNGWLNSLFLERSKWIPVYVKGHFWAGMSTSQRSESINAFFDDFVHSKTSLKQFVEQYDKALLKNIEKEKKLDFQSCNSVIPIVSGYAFERQFQSFYTLDIFKLFQQEVRGLMFCDISVVKDESTTFIFEVVENILGVDGEHLRDISYKVHYTELDCNVKCQCRMFEFRGILCRHIIAVLRRMKVNEVPMCYVMDRWRKDIKRGYQTITNIYDSDMSVEERKRYNSLTPLMQEVQHLGAKSEDNSSVLLNSLKALKEQFMSLEHNHGRADKGTEVSPSTGILIHSPLKVKARGRPRTKRKQSVIEKIGRKSASRSRNKPTTSMATTGSRFDTTSMPTTGSRFDTTSMPTSSQLSQVGSTTNAQTDVNALNPIDRTED